MEDYNDNTSWASISDVMSVLMMVFMFISIAFIYQLQNEKETYRLELNKALHKEFDKDLNKWNAEITNKNIVRFNAHFDMGSSNIPEKFKEILTVFFPRYIKVLTSNKFKNNTEEIRIEGHTSNGWGKNTSEEENYLNNMTLSQNRANNVLAFCYKIDNNNIISNNKKWLEKLLRANGMSFSKPIYEFNTTKPDPIKSRRVEFRVITKENKYDL
jgi:outer membrane protein OmpA-like peptidoglycan-associated protein